MAFERVTPNVATTPDPQLSVYPDGGTHINADADREWFEDFDRVAVYVDEGQCRLGLSPAADDDAQTYRISRNGDDPGGDISSRLAVRRLGILEDVDETLHVPLAKDDDAGLVIADVGAHLPSDNDTAAGDELVEDVDELVEDDDTSEGPVGVTTDDIAAALDAAEDEDGDDQEGDAPDPVDVDYDDLEPAIVEGDSAPPETPTVDDQDDAGDGAVAKTNGHGDAVLGRDDLDFLDPMDKVACGHCPDDEARDVRGLRIHHGHNHKGDVPLQAVPVEVSLPGSLTDHDIVVVADHYDTLDEIVEDLEVTEARARAILASRGLLEEVVGGA